VPVGAAAASGAVDDDGNLQTLTPTLATALQGLPDIVAGGGVVVRREAMTPANDPESLDRTGFLYYVYFEGGVFGTTSGSDPYDVISLGADEHAVCVDYDAFATANGVDKLPAELLGKGRFDEMFLLDLPSAEERRAILDLQLRRRRPDHSIPLEVLVDRTAGFSGAELEQTVIEAMHLAFAEHREFGEADLIAAASQVVPLSRTAREQLEALQIWASSGRARPASRAGGEP
jgi:hypothetical protein